MATGPDLRVGDADREAAAGRLREHYAQGRLTLEEFNQRLDAVFAATTRSQLGALTRDLPHITASSPPLPVTAAGTRREQGRQEQRSGFRTRLGMIPVIIGVLAAWLLMFDLHLRLFPWPGKLAIVLLIVGVARGLMRRIWHVGRGTRPMGRGRYPGRR
jgi:Domain of unknown function (DUF1707)